MLSGEFVSPLSCAVPAQHGIAHLSGNVAAVTTVLAVFSVVTLGCALFFPNRKEELEPELWANATLAAAE